MVQRFKIGVGVVMCLFVLVTILTAFPFSRAQAQGRGGGPAGPFGTALAYARVMADGTIDHDSGNVTVYKAPSGGGMYCIGITGGTVHAAVVSLDSFANSGGTVQAGVFWYSECPSDANNIFVVTRPQTQNGGLPGVDRAFYIIVN